MATTPGVSTTTHMQAGLATQREHEVGREAGEDLGGVVEVG